MILEEEPPRLLLCVLRSLAATSQHVAGSRNLDDEISGPHPLTRPLGGQRPRGLHTLGLHILDALSAPLVTHPIQGALHRNSSIVASHRVIDMLQHVNHILPIQSTLVNPNFDSPK